MSFHIADWKNKSLQGLLLSAIAGRAGTILSGLLISAAIARLLSPVDVAAYWMVISALSVVTLVAQSAVGQVTSALLAKLVEEGEARKVIDATRASIKFAGSMGVSFSFLAALLVFFATPQLPWSIRTAIVGVVIVCGPVTVLALQLIDVLRGSQRFVLSNLLASQPGTGGILPNAFLAGVLVVGFVSNWRGGALDWALGGLTIGWASLLLLVGSCVTIKSTDPTVTPPLSLKSDNFLDDIKAASARVMIGAVAMVLLTQVDLWAVSRWQSPYETALYGVASSMSRYVSAGNLLLAPFLPAIFGRLWASGRRDQLQSLVRRAAQFATAIAIVAVTVIAFWGGHILSLAFGRTYAPAHAAMLILAIGHLCNAALGYSQVLLIVAGRTDGIVAASMGSALVMIGALAVMVPALGAVGAAVASSLGLTTYSFITFVFAVRRTGIRTDAVSFIRSGRATSG